MERYDDGFAEEKDSGSNDWWKKSLPENTKSINRQTHQPDLPVRAQAEYFFKGKISFRIGCK